MKMRIAYQGVEGAYSHLTAVREFGKIHDFIGCKTFSEVFGSIDSGLVNVAMVPIENSLIGSIYENYDLLSRGEFQIIGECYTRIEHCFLVHPALDKLEMQSITKVFSHPKALEQCASFFQKYPWMEAVVCKDTALAALEVSRGAETTTAAIAGEIAGQLYGLRILQKGIEDDPLNYTRFVAVAKQTGKLSGEGKCSLLLNLRHLPGALATVLSVFAECGINVTKIESRPLRESPFEYLFYIDIESSNLDSSNLEKRLLHLHEVVVRLKILGIYRKGISWKS